LVIARRTACEPSAPCEAREGVFVRLTTGATRQSKLYDVPVAKHPPWLRARNLRASVAVAAAGVAVVFVTSACAPAKSDVKTRHVRQALRLPGAPPISSRDRVYTADMASNTVSVINPKTDRVLGTIPLGTDVLGKLLGPVDRSQAGVHGLGFSRNGRLLDVISVNSNAAQLIRTQNNQVASTAYLGRSPHEGFVSPDGKTLWVAVRGQRYVAVLSTQTGREVGRIGTAATAGSSSASLAQRGSLQTKRSPRTVANCGWDTRSPAR